ncbi:Serine/threonine-protein kinase PrkC [Posidoniimonas polymericola]|uniref:non-specific serine/threonine protein kinase n=1 Tax=Posidoniimonas polymericola TaxID=2528002 RepID=A0A5C5YPY6_9BACT|nr:serine/threonine-protein kinase [Posidoniimonas polymericola]TWT76965.1 Serine/threonine-protein kinase PrkC [Posidoniimonas polymericola]
MPTPPPEPPTDDTPTVSATGVTGPEGLSGPGDDSALISEIENTVFSSGKPIAEDAAYSGLRPKELGLALRGQTINEVLLEEFVGGGGMGAVFRGIDLALQRTVALKVLSTHHATDEETRRRFEVEAQSAARLDHPSIARVYSVGEARGLRYIIFEYVEGANLRDLVAENGPLGVADALSFAIQITDALQHAWRRDVVHRDIKPSNILITRDGRVKVVDMGLARLKQVDEERHDLTASGATLGTFDYIAPEQARDPRNADARSDIYSLGCTLFFMLTGRPPFPEGTALQKLLQHQGDRAPDIRTLRTSVPRDMARTIARMLAKRPEDRYADPSALLAVLLQLAQRLGVSTGALAASRPIIGEELAWRRHAPWMIAASVLVGAWLLWPRFAPTPEPPPPFESTDAAADSPLMLAPPN